MNKYCKLLLIVSIILVCCDSFAQKDTWTLGFRMGYKTEILEKTNPSDLNVSSTYGSISSPTIGLNLTYNITDRFSVASGIAYLEYYASWFVGGGDKWVNSRGGSLLLKYAQIPLNFKYVFPLCKSSFSIYGKFGFNFDILADIISDYNQDTIMLILPRYEHNYKLEYKHHATVYNKKTNILLNTGIGVAYRFKNGLGLSFEGEYYAGLRTMGQILMDIKKRSLFNYVLLDEYTDLLLVKGSYWNVNLGISYTFKKKGKSKENTTPEHIEIQIE